MLVSLAFPLMAAFSLSGASPPATPPPLGEGLRSPDAGARRAAVDALFKVDADITEQLIAQFNANSSDTDRKYGSARYWTIVALGQWRVTRVVPQLIEIMDFQIDRATYPAGGEQRTLSLLYPAAVALSKIGGKDMIRGVLAHGEEGKDVQLCAWILKDNLGRELALAAVKMQAQRASDKTNLATMQGFLEKDEEIMPWPRTAPPTTQGSTGNLR